MGRGGDGRLADEVALKLRKRVGSFSSLLPAELIPSLKNDMTVLRHMWFGKAWRGASDHASRLESFYGPQAAAYDKFRANFLWGRRPMLAACAARLANMPEKLGDIVWVDLGGGTGENVAMMDEYLGLENFKKIYVVDLCHSLCEVAKRKVQAKGWKNVQVVEGDACRFLPEGMATLVTFSYSLSMIPPFHQAVDAAVSYLDPQGFLGICDFFVSSRYDLPMRQMRWARRFFWRSVFDCDNIDIGPERRNYLETKLERVWEINGEGSIPYVPFLRAPYYVWVGQHRQLGHPPHENQVDRPALFPPTFLYTQSWEDPEPDMRVLDINPQDVCLTLTSGGCNALNLLIQGAGEVVSVDCNPAQSALLELKSVAIQQLPFEDVWQMFGEGRHPRIEQLYERRLAPFISQTGHQFWSKRLWYFKNGLYYQGGMGKLCWVIQCIFTLLGQGRAIKRFVNAPTLEEQRSMWDNNAVVHFLKHGPPMLVWLVCTAIHFLFFNRFVLWFGGGVPMKQYELIENDKLPIEKYVARTMDGVAENSHLRKHNHYYYNCLCGKFLRDNCPSFLTEAGYAKLRPIVNEQLTISTGTFLDELRARKYTKVILMDHVDWLDVGTVETLAAALAEQVLPGGIVIWRSAALRPPYTDTIARAGFEVRCISRADEGYMDRVNMYASFYVAKRLEAKQ